jgi:HEAT repeat protein
MLVQALKADEPKVQQAAAIAAGQLKRSEAADALLPLTNSEHHRLALVAIEALRRADAVGPLLNAVKQWPSDRIEGPLDALKLMHQSNVVKGLIELSREVTPQEKKQQVLIALMRLYNKPGEWDGSWWGTRSDACGPYFEPATWKASDAIVQTLRQAVADAPAVEAKSLLQQMSRHQVQWDGMLSWLAGLAKQPPALKPLAASLIGQRSDVPEVMETLLAEVAGDSSIDSDTRLKAANGLLEIDTDSSFKQAMQTLAALTFGKDSRQRRRWGVVRKWHRNQNHLGVIESLLKSEEPSVKRLAYESLAYMVNASQNKKK